MKTEVKEINNTYIDNLNADSVIVTKENYYEFAGHKTESKIEKVSYWNSLRNIKLLKNEVSQEYYDAIMAVWALREPDNDLEVEE